MSGFHDLGIQVLKNIKIPHQ